MSTRSILKDRKKQLIWLNKKEPSAGLQKAIAEIDFIFEKLREHDKEGSSTENNNRSDSDS